MRACLLLLCLAALWPMGACADESCSSMVVSAQVVPVAQLTTVQSPTSMLVTTRDIRRGIKTIFVRLRLNGNSLAGYLLHMMPHVGLTTQMVVHGLSNDLMITDEGADFSLPPGAAGAELSLRIELQLKPGAPAGRYPLPLAFSVSPDPHA